MNTLSYCAIGAVMCVAWFFAHGRLFNWKEDQPTLFRQSVEFTSRILLACAVTLIGFTVVGTVVAMLVNAMLRT